MVTHKIVNGNYKIVKCYYRIVNGKIVNRTFHNFLVNINNL
jgi:hypothetical protein